MLGEGALGVVYRASHTRLSRRFAIKVPFGDIAADSNARARFAREAEAACRLGHPNVVAAVDVGETPEGLLYLVMELAEGPTLAEVIDEGRMPPHRALGIVARIARGLAHAHQRGLVHRDLKPANVILEEGDRPRIVDFGIALVAGGADGPRLTEHGLVVGTPWYMAPEQALGESVDARTDVFALGVIAYELLSGVLPHEGDPFEVVRRYVTEPTPLVCDRVPGLVLSPDVEAFLQRLLARQPADRPGDAGAVADEADRLAAAPRPKPRSRKHRVAMAALRKTLLPPFGAKKPGSDRSG